MKGFAQIWLIVGAVIIIIAGGAFYFSKVKTPVQKACTVDAKICPDGSSVGRSGPNCEFALCPTNSSPTIDPKIDSKEKFLESYEVDPSGWKKYVIKPVRLEFKIPDLLLRQGELRETVDKGQVGQQIIISSVDEFLSFSLGFSTIDYQQGRGGGFLDYQGFEIKNGKYYAKFVGDQKFEIASELVTQVTNPNNLQIIKIKGKNVVYNESFGESPEYGSPGSGKIGALININNRTSTYQGLAVQMRLDKELTEGLFDQILSTFKFTD